MRALLLLLVLVPPSSTMADWELVWSDEFDEPGLPSAEKWSFEEGFRRNREAQYYTVNRPENARVADGMLTITARRERWPNSNFDPDSRERNRQSADYTSASLHTRGKAAWTYGRIEVRAKVPGGRGTWPAIWMLGTNIRDVGWPTCGEIDIMEHVGFEPRRLHANIHTARYNHAEGTGKGDHLDLDNAVTDFHVYRVDWEPEVMRFFIDDQLYFAYEREPDTPGALAWPFDKPHYLILNLAIGGTWGGREGIDDSIFPAEYQIDYVRVFQQP